MAREFIVKKGLIVYNTSGLTVLQTNFNGISLPESDPQNDISYINFNDTGYTGDIGYGIRDNQGVIEVKNSGGTWNSTSYTNWLSANTSYYTQGQANANFLSANTQNFLSANTSYYTQGQANANFLSANTSYQAAGSYLSANTQNFLSANTIIVTANQFLSANTINNFLSANTINNWVSANTQNFLSANTSYYTQGQANANFLSANTSYQAAGSYLSANTQNFLSANTIIVTANQFLSANTINNFLSANTINNWVSANTQNFLSANTSYYTQGQANANFLSANTSYQAAGSYLSANTQNFLSANTNLNFNNLYLSANTSFYTQAQVNTNFLSANTSYQAAGSYLSANTQNFLSANTNLNFNNLYLSANTSFYTQAQANANFLSANTSNYLLTYSTTVTAGATTTLTSASNYNQYFTGTLNQIVVLPVVSTLSLGFCFNIVNLGTGVITIESSGGNQVLQLIQQNSTSPTVVLLTCIAITGTGIASWSYESGVMPSQSTTEYALTLTNNGVKQNYTISQQNVSVGTLASQNWSTGQVTLTGTQGTFAYDTSYVYFCILSNTWIRLVIAMGATLVQQYINYINTPVTDSPGSPLSTATLNSDYPSALNGQRVLGIYYVYEFQGVNSTWVAISKINI